VPELDPIFATRTTTRLLDALRDNANEPVWTQIDARYRPVIRGLARRIGVPEAEADDVAQQSLAEFVRCFRDGRYDRTKGRLSSWILSIAHHTSLAAIRRRRRDSGGGPGAGGAAPVAGGAEGVDPADPASAERALRNVWNEERDRVILHHAMATLHDEGSMDERTLLAFELSALRGVPAGEAASQCQMTVEQLYVARSRVTRRLRVMVREMTSAFEEDA
jgi:RNA polymerase sigma factor (sigma-70 family)